jgi:hypothetical protein
MKLMLASLSMQSLNLLRVDLPPPINAVREGGTTR